MNEYLKARNFIYRHARPIELARWSYLFENGSKQDVLTCLQEYQNSDGGFGNALEPDCWNPNSSPLQTWNATMILREIDFQDKTHPIIEGIINYLVTIYDGQNFTGLNGTASNNDYPHAPWWHYIKGSQPNYNPTASLLGFMVKFINKNTDIYDAIIIHIQKAYIYFVDNYPLDSMHEVACFVELYEYIKDEDIIDTIKFKEAIEKQIRYLIESDISCWHDNYVCKPSLFIKNKNSDFYYSNKEKCKLELQFIKDTQERDGTWKVTWKWDEYLEQWPIAMMWWKSDIIIKNIEFIKTFE